MHEPVYVITLIMLHLWLIPLIVLLAFIVFILYMAVRAKGGTGVRTEGRTLHHEPRDEDNPPP